MNRNWISALLLILMACSTTETNNPVQSSTSETQPEKWTGHFFASEITLNIAHRGGAREWPEHTILAYEECLKAGADVLEIDVHMTKDGHIVVMHDGTVHDTTDGSGWLKDMTLEEVRALDAGYQFTPDGGKTYPYRGKGLKVPTFDEVLERFSDTPMLIEPKAEEQELLEKMLAIAHEYELYDTAVFGAFPEESVQFIREDDARWVTGLKISEMVLFSSAQNEEQYAAPASTAQMPYDTIDAQVIANANEFGVRIHAWTVNNEDDMRRLLDQGIHAIITDRPSTLAQMLTEY